MAAAIQRWKRTFYERIAGEISAMTRYYDAVIQFEPVPSDTGYLLECIDAPQKSVASEIDLRPERYTHYYRQEFPRRFHDMMDTRRWGPGERIVFEKVRED